MTNQQGAPEALANFDAAVAAVLQCVGTAPQADSQPAPEYVGNGMFKGETIQKAAEHWANWCDRRCMNGLAEFLRVVAAHAPTDSQPAPVLDYPPLPRVGAIGYASVVDIESYAKTLTIGPHLPGVRDIALWTTDQMRAYADETYALRIGAKHA